MTPWMVFVWCVYGVLILTLLGNLIYLNSTRPGSSETPSVSILIPARNESSNLRRLIPSLLSQEYPDFEVIVYDDGSEDNTWEVIQSFPDITGIQGNGPPSGWMGKVHALFQASKSASRDVLLFLDADTELRHPVALQNMVSRFCGGPDRTVLTGLGRLGGGGLILVSLLPFAMLAALPWFMTRHLPFKSLGALNGQVWMIDRKLYEETEPHLNNKGEILEDVEIARYLKALGINSRLSILTRDLNVFMYTSLPDAWAGLRKNAYLLIGGSVPAYLILGSLLTLVFLVAPLFSYFFLIPIFLLKVVCDRIGNIPVWVSLLSPVSFLLGGLVSLDSAVAHWTGRVSWKGRSVK